MGNVVITIGREYGSGGLEVGEKLAERLGIECYNNRLITKTAHESGLCEEVIQNNDERTGNGILASLVMDTYSVRGYSMAPYTEVPMNHRIFLAQFDIIKKLAEKESCVIIGRCADYALDGCPETVKIFITAPIDYRKERIKIDPRYDVEGIKNDDKLKDFINKLDRKRANYYNYYTGKKWGDSSSYDLTIDSSILGLDGTVEMICQYLMLRFPDKYN